MSVVGRTYLERGEPVVVLKRWRERHTDDPAPRVVVHGLTRTRTVRNVLIRRKSGELVVRPFRGLRKVAT